MRLKKLKILKKLHQSVILKVVEVQEDRKRIQLMMVL